MEHDHFARIAPARHAAGVSHAAADKQPAAVIVSVRQAGENPLSRRVQAVAEQLNLPAVRMAGERQVNA